MRTLPLGVGAIPTCPNWTVSAARPITATRPVVAAPTIIAACPVAATPVIPAPGAVPAAAVGVFAVGRAAHRIPTRGVPARRTVGRPGRTLRLTPVAPPVPSAVPGRVIARRTPAVADRTAGDPARASPRPALGPVAAAARTVVPVRHGTILQPR